MPFARLTLHPAPPPAQAERLGAELTELIGRDLGKQRSLTSVLVETPGWGRWTIAGEARSAAAHLEVCVTAGTNSEAQKRTFIDNSMNLLRNLAPDLHSATYVVVRELPATDWGFDGRTQADRARERS